MPAIAALYLPPLLAESRILNARISRGCTPKRTFCYLSLRFAYYNLDRRMRFGRNAMNVGNASRIDEVKEARLLSLASSVVFLGVLTIFVFVSLGALPDPLIQFFEYNRFLLLFVPLVMPIAAIIRLANLWFSRNIRMPFIDGWLVHVLILIPYTIIARAIVPL